MDSNKVDSEVDNDDGERIIEKTNDDWRMEVRSNSEARGDGPVVYLSKNEKDKEFQNVELVVRTKDPKEAESGTVGKPWKAYEDAGLEMPVSFLVPPAYYKFRWAWVRVFQKNVFLDVCIGEIIMFILVLAVSVAPAGATCCSMESTGGAACVPLLLTYAVASRNSIFTFIFGVPFERTLKWHKWLALFSVASGIYHGVLSRKGDSDEVTSGIILTALMGALLVFSFFPIRRAIFEIFLKFHWLLFIAVIVVAIIHEASVVMAGAGIWAFDVLCRCVILWWNRSNSAKALAIKLPADVIRISFKKNKFKYKSGQYVFLCIPKVSYFEWHPFSISSSPHHDEVFLHVRVLGNWTKQLYKAADSTEITVFIDGPYGQPSVDVDSDRYKILLFVSGGIGITPMQSICNDIVNQYKRGRPLLRIYFIWSVRDAFMVSSVLDYDKQYFGNKISQRLPHSFSPDLVTENLGESVLDAQFYLTRAREAQDYEAANINPGLQPCLKFGRPDLEKIFDCVHAEAVANNEKNVAVLSCGPDRLVKDVLKFSNRFSKDGISFDFHSELFEF